MPDPEERARSVVLRSCSVQLVHVLVAQEERARSVVLTSCSCHRERLGSLMCFTHLEIAHVIDAALLSQADTFRRLEPAQ